MSEKITVIVFASTQYIGSEYQLEIEIDKSEYDNAEDKDAFLQEIYNEYISDVIETGVYIKED